MKVTQRIKNNLDDVLADFSTKTALGYNAFFGVENKSNPFFSVLMCATQNKNIDFSTGIAVAFSKTPMVMAMESYSLNQYCKGNFTLGIASQIKPHIIRRFGMPWTSKPATQMREYIKALHAIWDAFESDGPLNFEGETYKHTLISPEFVPFKEGYGRPKILLGAVGPGMNKVAGDLADGMISHSFVSEKSLREINNQIITESLARRNKPRSEFELVYPAFVVTGSNEEEYKKNIAWHRHRLGFYASTPAYKVQLDLHGWGDIQKETHKMTKEGRWDDLWQPITDEMLDTFTIMGEPHEIAPKIKDRFGDFVDTIQCNLELENEEVQYSIVKAIEDI